ncbi:hypothetical protein JHD50_08845 [Sulfurimonas sp. MAG313]|nr:hypothetical protein [Sulfurimonas sp. MAG313]MDF1881404.1 hypothetical protein [Sulfurimonas sp. MAG313]
MASAQSYEITLKNNITEKEAVLFLMESNPSFIEPDKESRKAILQHFGLNAKFIRAFDLIQVDGHVNSEEKFILKPTDKVTLIEIKSTKKRLENNPYGFFFGATENEFSIANKLGKNYKFCFVCLHPDTKSYVTLSSHEIDDITKNKRIQYQINLQTKPTR